MSRFTINDREVSYEEYKNSTEDGVRKWYYDNGQLGIEEPWKNGKRHGVHKWYYENGQLERITIFVHNKERPELLDPEHRLTYAVIFGERQPE